MRKDVWWKDEDYRTFRETGLLLARPTSKGCGWMKQEHELTGGGNNPDGSTVHESRGLDHGRISNGRATEDCITKGKWWCSYGHSRRGLEHVSNPESGYARHEAVRGHIEGVIREQERQDR